MGRDLCERKGFPQAYCPRKEIYVSHVTLIIVAASSFLSAGIAIEDESIFVGQRELISSVLCMIIF